MVPITAWATHYWIMKIRYKSWRRAYLLKYWRIFLILSLQTAIILLFQPALKYWKNLNYMWKLKKIRFMDNRYISNRCFIFLQKTNLKLVLIERHLIRSNPNWIDATVLKLVGTKLCDIYFIISKLLSRVTSLVRFVICTYLKYCNKK